MKNYTCNDVNTFLVEYIEHHKSKNNIPYHISINTLFHLLEELEEDYKKIESKEED